MSYSQIPNAKSFSESTSAQNESVHSQSKEGHPIGATGNGKSFLGNALGIHACEAGYKVKHVRMIELLSDLEINKLQNTYCQFIKQLAKFDLLIIDDFLLNRLEAYHYPMKANDCFR